MRVVDPRITDDGVQRIARQVTRLERAVQEPAIPERGRFPAGAVQGLFAKTGGGGVAARSGATLGSGVVTVYKADALGVLSATTTTLTAYNLAGSAVGANKYIVIIPVAGLWVVAVEDCAT